MGLLGEGGCVGGRLLAHYRGGRVCGNVPAILPTARQSLASQCVASGELGNEMQGETTMDFLKPPDGLVEPTPEGPLA